MMYSTDVPTDPTVRSGEYSCTNMATHADTGAEPLSTTRNTNTAAATATGKNAEDGIVYPQGIRLALIIMPSYLTMFLVALVSLSPVLTYLLKQPPRARCSDHSSHSNARDETYALYQEPNQG